MNRINCWRNHLYVFICNKILGKLPTPEYRAYAQGIAEYGMRAAVGDHREGRDMPPDWRTISEPGRS